MDSDQIEYRRPEDYGYWDGSVFIFTPPIQVMSNDGPRFMQTLDLSKAVLAAGIEPQDVVHAMLNPIEGPLDLELRRLTGDL